MQQAYRFRQEITSLQQKLTQRGFDLIKKQHELGRLKQQLQDATGKAERAQAAAAAMRCGLSFCQRGWHTTTHLRRVRRLSSGFVGHSNVVLSGIGTDYMQSHASGMNHLAQTLGRLQPWDHQMHYTSCFMLRTWWECGYCGAVTHFLSLKQWCVWHTKAYLLLCVMHTAGKSTCVSIKIFPTP